MCYFARLSAICVCLSGYAHHLCSKNRVPELWGVVKVPFTAPQMPYMLSRMLFLAGYAHGYAENHTAIPFLCFSLCSKSPIVLKELRA